VNEVTEITIEIPEAKSPRFWMLRDGAVFTCAGRTYIKVSDHRNGGAFGARLDTRPGKLVPASAFDNRLVHPYAKVRLSCE
jgi:hypothetical protein